MPASCILPDPGRLHLICVYPDPDRIILAARVKGRQARCPLCGQPSGRIHSRYVRAINDLPWQGMPVRLRLHPRRFFCDSPTCERCIFTERVSEVAAPYARRTHRLGEWLTHVAKAARAARCAYRRGYVPRPHPLLWAWGQADAKGAERGRLLVLKRSHVQYSARGPGATQGRRPPSRSECWVIRSLAR